MRPAKRKKSNPNVVLWRMTEKTYNMYSAYYRVLIDAEPFSEEYHEALDGIQSLPNYPVGFGGHDEHRELIPKLIDPIQASVN